MSENFDSSILGDFRQSFENLCLQILHEGYEFMLAAQKYQTHWAEESLTAHYCWCLEQIRLVTDWQIFIYCEARLYDEKYIFEGLSAKAAPRIDMQMSRWENREKVFFRVEAKILFENDKPLPSGGKASAIRGHQRYIETGIEHFLSGHYPLPGCLVGYVVEGNLPTITASINELIHTTGRTPHVGLIQSNGATKFTEWYCSDNQSDKGVIRLSHFLLKL